MHEFPYNPPDYGSSERDSTLSFPAISEASFSRLQREAFICELAGSAARLRPLRRTVLVIVAVAPFVRQITVSALFRAWRACTGLVANRRADGIRAMPSARALLVASLLTEPPYGCLGPSGNDRYRKRSLRSQTAGASQVNCQVAAALSQ